ncbi:diguanylate cyclase (GGDEF)-like protein [Rhodoligotrophos appendicifer]|uniref:GGDEF domain-containing protein n=1 Tax=Rhodoligotrophos appendicifer TaxID=987056 RepID=UPI001478FEB4|nr:GGDEF domain-containing protein [Rhodoligotrophos appendicifer]
MAERRALMTLDIYTILILLVAVCALICCVLLVTWWRHRETQAYLWWSGACSLGGIGLILILLRGQIHDILSISLANALVLLGVGMAWAGTRSLFRRPVKLWQLLGPSVPWLIALCFDPVMDDPAIRTILLSAIAAVSCFAIALELWRGRSEYLPSGGPLIALTVLNGAFYAVRGVVAASRTVPDDLAIQGFWFGLSLVEATLFIIAAAMFAVTLIRERSERRLMAIAARDPLTQVLNRRGFFSSAEALLAVLRGSGRTVALLLFDLDSFKSVNDRYGHAAGDVVLEKFGQIASEMLPAEALLCRLGGEEFAALLPDMQAAAATDLGEHLRARIAAQAFVYRGSQVRATVSVGVAVLTGEAIELQRLMTIADHALYEAKAAGRNRVRFSAAPVA